MRVSVQSDVAAVGEVWRRKVLGAGDQVDSFGLRARVKTLVKEEALSSKNCEPLCGCSDGQEQADPHPFGL